MPRRLIRAVCLTFALVLAAAAGAASADQVLMKNGDRLSGTIVNKGPEKITLQTPYAGALKLPWSEVAGIATDAPARVLLQDGTDLTGEIAPAGGELEIRDAAGGAPRRVPLAAVAFINPTPVQSGEGWMSTGRVGLGVTDTSGNSNTQRVYGDADATWRAKMQRLNLGARVNRADDQGMVTASNWLGRANYDRFFDKQRFWYARTSFEHDRLKDLDLRGTVGGGFGYQIFEGPVMNLSVQGGADLVSVKRGAGEDENYPAAGWGVRFDRWLIEERLQAFHTHDGYIALTAGRGTLVRTQTGLRAPLAGGLDASLQLNVDWESDPAPGRNATDRTWILGVGYGW